MKIIHSRAVRSDYRSLRGFFPELRIVGPYSGFSYLAGFQKFHYRPNATLAWTIGFKSKIFK
jgi:hypothetical protein